MFGEGSSVDIVVTEEVVVAAVPARPLEEVLKDVRRVAGEVQTV